MAPRTAFIHSEEIEQYHYPEDCPFKTERTAETKRILQSMGYYSGAGRREVAPRAATEKELLAFHTREYLATLEKVSRGKVEAKDLFAGLGSDDTPIFRELNNYARLAAGGSIVGAELLLNNKVDIAFNFSGGYHHAETDKAGGFCYINDVALACAKLADEGKAVLCLDFDAHHGNGTQAAFYDDRRVLTVSFHETGKTLYPWGGFENEIGEGAGAGYNLNMPFPQNTDDDVYKRTFDELVPPLAEGFDPDVLIVEIGMDILSLDPLTHLSMTNNVIADILPILQNMGKPILLVGGGGYNPEHCARGWALAWCVLNHIEMEEDLYMGLGGVFLGSAEWNAGLRDQHIYLQGQEKIAVVEQVAASIEQLKQSVLARHI